MMDACKACSLVKRLGDTATKMGFSQVLLPVFLEGFRRQMQSSIREQRVGVGHVP